jgi:hypothetical protein
MKELVKVEEATVLQAFSEGCGLNKIIEEVKSVVHGFDHDMSTATSRKKTASLSMKVRKLKTRLDSMGKELTSEWKAKAKAVDVNRKMIRDELDALAAEARKPLDEFELKERERVDEIQKRLRTIISFREIRDGDCSDQITAMINELKNFTIDKSFEEFENEAHREKEISLKSLANAYEKQLKIEEEQAELARLKAEAKERDRKEREAQIAREAKEKAKQEAEEAAKREREAAEQEIQRIEAEKQAAIIREREAEQRAKEEQQARIEAEIRAKIEAERAAERARIAEINRQKEKEAKEAKEQERRNADLNHIRNYKLEAYKALMQEGLTKEHSINVVNAIESGRIPHVSITY